MVINRRGLPKPPPYNTTPIPRRETQIERTKHVILEPQKSTKNTRLNGPQSNPLSFANVSGGGARPCPSRTSSFGASPAGASPSAGSPSNSQRSHVRPTPLPQFHDEDLAGPTNKSCCLTSLSCERRMGPAVATCPKGMSTLCCTRAL